MTTPLSFSDTLAKIKADGDAQMDQLRKHVATRAGSNPPTLAPVASVKAAPPPVTDPPMVKPAFAYAARGWPVLPVNGKIPLLKEWPAKATTDCETIRTWWTHWPAANVGIATGKQADLLVLDVDPGKGGIESLRALEEQFGALPHTIEVVTGGGGRHMYFKHPGLPVGNSASQLGPGLDIKTDGGQVVAPPSIHPTTGRAYEWEAAHHPDDVPLAAVPRWLLEKLTAATRPGVPFTVPEKILDGERNDIFYKLARSLKAKGLSRKAIRDALVAENAVRCDHPLSDAEVEALAEHAWTQADRPFTPRPARPVPTDEPAPAGSTAEGAPSEATTAEKTEAKSEATAALPPGPDARTRCTDVGNGELFAEQHRETVRYCYRLKQWFVWDGQRWNPDDGGRITLLAKQTALSLYARVTQEPDEHRRKALAKWAVESETERRLRSMVSLAQSEPGIAIEADRLDADPLRLNVLNGTLDLRAGDLRPARREDYITKLAPVAYHPDAACPEFDRMLTRLFGTVPAIRDYLQRILGYALTGVTTEQCFFIFYGTGANGKSTVLRTIMDLLGEYADTSRPETFLVKRGDGGIPNDVAALAGMRLVVSLESEKGKRLAEGLVKGMTGQDRMKARFLHREFFSFDPRFKLFIGTNHKPVIVGTDEAIWRRVRCVPFTVVIPDHEQDKRLLDKLRAEYEGILRWLIEGCLAWQCEGLGPPLEVQDATAAYRAEQDVLGVFLKDRCVMEPTAKSTKKDLYEQYTAWCEESGERHRLTMTEFGKALRERGIGNARVGNAKGWGGLRRRTPLDPEPDDDPVTAQDQEESDVNLDA